MAGKRVKGVEIPVSEEIKANASQANEELKKHGKTIDEVSNKVDKLKEKISSKINVENFKEVNKEYQKLKQEAQTLYGADFNTPLKPSPDAGKEEINNLKIREKILKEQYKELFGIPKKDITVSNIKSIDDIMSETYGEMIKQQKQSPFTTNVREQVESAVQETAKVEKEASKIRQSSFDKESREQLATQKHNNDVILANEKANNKLILQNNKTKNELLLLDAKQRYRKEMQLFREAQKSALKQERTIKVEDYKQQFVEQFRGVEGTQFKLDELSKHIASQSKIYSEEIIKINSLENIGAEEQQKKINLQKEIYENELKISGIKKAQAQLDKEENLEVDRQLKAEKELEKEKERKSKEEQEYFANIIKSTSEQIDAERAYIQSKEYHINKQRELDDVFRATSKEEQEYFNISKKAAYEALDAERKLAEEKTKVSHAEKEKELYEAFGVKTAEQLKAIKEMEDAEKAIQSYFEKESKSISSSSKATKEKTQEYAKQRKEAKELEEYIKKLVKLAEEEEKAYKDLVNGIKDSITQTVDAFGNLAQASANALSIIDSGMAQLKSAQIKTFTDTIKGATVAITAFATGNVFAGAIAGLNTIVSLMNGIVAQEKAMIAMLKQAPAQIKKIASLLSNTIFAPITKSFGKVFGLMNTLVKRLGSQTIRRIAMNILKEFEGAFEASLESLYKWSEARGQNFHKAMDQIQTNMVYLRNAMIAMLSNAFEWLTNQTIQVGDQMVSVVEYVTDKIVAVFNEINQLMAILLNKKTYTAAVKASQKYSDNFAKASKEANKLLGAYDKLNVIKQDTSGGQTHTDEEFSKMFKLEQVELDKSEFENIGKTFADYINNLFSEENIENVRDKIENFINNIINFTNDFFENVEWFNIGERLSNSLVTAIQNITPEKIGHALSLVINSAIDFASGLLTNADILITQLFEIIKTTISDLNKNGKAKQLAQKIYDLIGVALKLAKEFLTGKEFSDFIKQLFDTETIANLIKTYFEVRKIYDEVFAEVEKTIKKEYLKSKYGEGIGTIIGNILFPESTPEKMKKYANKMGYTTTEEFNSGIDDGLNEVYSKGEEIVETNLSGIYSGLGTGKTIAGSMVHASLGPVFDPDLNLLKNDVIEYGKNTSDYFVTSLDTELGTGLDTTTSNISERMTNLGSQSVSSLKGSISTVWDDTKDIWSNYETNTSTTWGKINKGLSTSGNETKNSLTSTFDKLKTSLGSIFDGMWSKIKVVINAILGGVEKLANGVINARNSIVRAFNALHIDIPSWVPGVGGKTLGFNMSIADNISIPRLAQGAVIPANREFLAVLGDQKAGTNIEAPLETIQQALANVLSQQGTNQPIVLQLNGKDIAKAVWDENEKRYKQTGVRFSY